MHSILRHSQRLYRTIHIIIYIIRWILHRWKNYRFDTKFHQKPILWEFRCHCFGRSRFLSSIHLLSAAAAHRNMWQSDEGGGRGKCMWYFWVKTNLLSLTKKYSNAILFSASKRLCVWNRRELVMYVQHFMILLTTEKKNEAGDQHSNERGENCIYFATNNVNAQLH